jgi:thiol-disulfide isomerase/thioredoxin/outer membrane lipoprotein-sorting protein
MGTRLRIVASLLALIAPALSAQTSTSSQTTRTDETALQLLREVTAKYARAVRSHIEMASEAIQSSEMYSSQQKVTDFAYEEPGNRYRFGGRNALGSGLVVSDGTTEWELHSARGEYTRRTAGAYGHPFPQSVNAATDGPEERNAYFMRRNLGAIAIYLKAAHWQTDEVITVADQKIDCWRIVVREEDFVSYTPTPNATTSDTTYWIDKARKLIVKTERISTVKRGEAPYGDALRTTYTVIYPVVSLDEPISDDVFTFAAPSTAKLVDNFVDPYARYQRPAAASAPLASPNYVGTPAPDLIFKAVDGTTLSLASLRGKPVLLDLWATWCGPCLLEMPTIDRIYRYGKSAGLTVLGIDQDKKPNDALAYLEKENYGWQDFHDGWNGKYEHLGVTGEGIPMLMLINADGKIVYFHSGADDDAGLLVAIRHLGPAFSAAIEASEK